MIMPNPLDKYQFKPSRNPGPGEYDIDSAFVHTKTKSYEAFFSGKNSPDKKRD
jgi:hypothetical protein